MLDNYLYGNAQDFFFGGQCMTTEDERVKVSLEKDADAHVARITIDNPERKNAWDPEMRRQMGTFLDELATDDDIKVVILRGAGGVFSTGADMNNAYNWYGPGDSKRRPSQRRRLGVDRQTFSFYHEFLSCPKVTIAQVEAYALGGAFELALMSDLAVVGRDAQLGMPGARLLGPALGNLHLFFHRLGPVLARRLLLTGDMVAAGDVEHLGLFTEVCDADVRRRPHRVTGRPRSRGCRPTASPSPRPASTWSSRARPTSARRPPAS